MLKRTFRKKRIRKKTIRRKIKGAGNQIDACAKYNLKGINTATLPTPVKIDKSSQNILSTISAAIKEIPSNDMLILKVGSNDSVAAIQEGSRGKNGTLFIEAPISAPNGTATTLIDMRNPVTNRQLTTINNVLHKKLPEVSSHLICISPVREYVEFSWPFIPSISGDEIYMALLNLNFTEKITSQKYLQTFFPIAPGDTADASTQILDLIVSREGPLVLFNAMGSLCFRSLKYIVDMRRLAGKLTIYMGLVDVGDVASCDLHAPVYPNGDKSCPQ
jgi:hypothetical protein